MKNVFSSLILACSLSSFAFAEEATPTPAAAPAATPAKAKAKAEKHEAETTVQGELVDLACYLEHGGRGEKHKACATSCAQNGLPIGLLDKHGKLYLVVGDHKPMNTQLADKMGDTVKATGKVSSRSGMKLLEISKVE